MAYSRKARLRHRAREVALQLVYTFMLCPDRPRRDTLELFPAEEAFDLFEEEQLVSAEEEAPRFQNVTEFNLQMSEGERDSVMSFAAQIFGGVRDNIIKIDEIIRNGIERNWRLERISAVDKSVISIAIYEAYIGKNAPVNVVISEAVELAKTFGSEDSARFVNGLLGSIARNSSDDTK